MRLIKLFISILAVQLVTSNLNAQNQLTKIAKTEVVNNLAKSLLDNYVFADKAGKMKNQIQKNLAGGLYDNIKNPNEFADILTRDLRSVYKDLHLSVRFNPGLEKRLSDHSEKSGEKQIQAIEEAKKQNFGFKKVEMLDSNIGYVYFDRFYDLSNTAKETVEKIFSSLKNSDALIFDVRYNGGGSPDMVKYIALNLSPLILLSGAYEGKKGLSKPPTFFQKAKILASSIFRPSYQVVEYYRDGMTVTKDPLFNFRYTLRFLTMLDVKKLRLSPNLNIPVLVGVGDKDELFDVDKVKEFYNAVPGNKKEFLVMKDATHARIPLESWEEIVAWLNKNF